MKPEAQRIAIAKASGWEHVHWNGGDSIPFGDNPNGNKIDRAYDRLPDYLNDLNAMREAEKVLTKEQKRGDGYAARIADVTGCDDMLFAFIHASAAQRAEAFLKTIGKWE